MNDYKTRVLLVEDEELARKTLSFYLNTIFDEVLVACDGQEGIDLFKEQSFDLVLTDIRMPNKDGLTMIDEMLEINTDQRFIIVSAHKNEEDLLKLINLRVLGYFVKPLNIDDMMDMLQKAKTELLADKAGQETKDSDEVVKLNNELKAFCDDNLLDYIDNENIDESCLGIKKLHLNRKGNAYLAKNIINYTKSVY